MSAAGSAACSPPGVVRAGPALLCHGMPGSPRRFAGLAVGPDGDLRLSVDGEGGVLRLTAAPGRATPGAEPEP